MYETALPASCTEASKPNQVATTALPKSNDTKLTKQTDRLLAHRIVTERPRSSAASNHEPWKVGEDFSSPSLLKGLKQDSLRCHESAGDMWRNFFFVTEWRKVKCSFIQLLSNLDSAGTSSSLSKKQLRQNVERRTTHPARFVEGVTFHHEHTAALDALAHNNY